MTSQALTASLPWREHAQWEIHLGMVCVECPGCGFCFGADHVDDASGRYSCPSCGTVESELAAALREIAA